MADDDLDLMNRPVNSLTLEQRHERRMGWFVAEAYRQASNRSRMARCEQYYDQQQTDEERRRTIEARGQTVVQYDMVTPQIDWLIGTERRMRIDEKIMPRQALDPQATDDADAKTQLLKWIDDYNRTGYQRSAAWDDAMKAGMGWLEVFAHHDKDEGWMVGKCAVPWKMVLYDSLGLDKTGTGKMRYLFRMKPVDVDIAIAHFPSKRAEILRVAQAATGFNELRSWMGMPGAVMDLDSIMGRLDNDAGQGMPSDMYNARQRVLLVECWSMEPYQEKTDDPSLDAPVRFRPMVSVMTEFDTIWEGWSPYEHDQIPFVPYWAYANKTTGLPYSLIWRLIPRQDALNKVMSRALHDISTDQLHMEEEAVNDEIMTVEEIRNELDDPGGIAVFAKGALEGNRVRTVKNTESAEAHMNMASKLAESLETSAVVNRGATGGAMPGASGAAMGKREDQSTLQTAEFFDGLVLAHIMEGELTLSVMQQYMRAPKVIPGKDPRGAPIAVAVNQPGKPTLGEIRARYVITEQPWRASLGQAQFESLMLVLKDMAGAAPQVVMALLDTVFEYADIPNKQQVVERIRSVTGQQAPDQKPTPDQILMAQRKQQLAEAEFQKTLAEFVADAKVAAAKGFQLQADTWVKRLEALGLASTVATQAAMNPLLTPATDAILASVGMTDMHPDAGAAPVQIPDTSGAAQPATPGAPPTPSALPARPPQPVAMMTPPKPAPLPYPGAPA